MTLYEAYLEEIEMRKEQGLNPKPIDGDALTQEIIAQIKNVEHVHRAKSLQFLIYNTLPGTTRAAGEKAQFLKEIVIGESVVEEISTQFAFELLSHMKGGPSVKVLLDLALSNDPIIAEQAGEVLKTQFFLYDADTDRLEAAYENGNILFPDVKVIIGNTNKDGPQAWIDQNNQFY